jgi:hypothetical protein
MGLRTEETDWAARGRSWWSHVRTLADDAMEGRATGTAAYERAADYVIEQFRAAGLEPAGSDGYRQRLDFRVNELDEKASTLDLIRNGSSQPLRLREIAQFIVYSETASDLDAEAVFVGYGLDIPELNYSDLAGLDLRGKIAVYIRGGPPELPAAVKAHYQSPQERFRTMRRAGAVGIAMMLNPNVPDLPWDRWASGLLFPRMQLQAEDAGEARPLAFSIVLDSEHLDLLLKESGHSATEVLAGLGKPGPLPRFPLRARLRAHVIVRRSTAQSTNVVGVLPGSDPTLRSEYVVGSAHLDHLGVGEPVDGDSVYNGAMDNASGVATLIEIARQASSSGIRPRRSMVFLAVTGEEKGLLGSEHFARHPSVSGRIVADLNMDMFLPLYPFKHLEVQGLEESTLGPLLRSTAQEVGVKTHGPYFPDQVLFVRSDQYNFVKVGVPSLMVGMGYEPGSEQEEVFKAWFRERYHSPADDIDQPVDLAAAAQFSEFLGRVMLKVANETQRPSWNADSFFRKFAG